MAPLAARGGKRRSLSKVSGSAPHFTFPVFWGDMLRVKPRCGGIGLCRLFSPSLVSTGSNPIRVDPSTKLLTSPFLPLRDLAAVCKGLKQLWHFDILPKESIVMPLKKTCQLYDCRHIRSIICNSTAAILLESFGSPERPRPFSLPLASSVGGL